MRIEIDNVKCRAIIGGKDHLLDVNLAKALKEYLRVRPEGYFHSLMYKRRVWDGWRYFITDKGDFATGFLPLVVAFCEDHGAEVELIDKRGNIVAIRDEINTDIRHYHLMTHQVRAMEKLRDGKFRGLPFPRGVFYCATNSGKTAMAAGILHNLQAVDGRSLRSLFIVHNKDIHKQAVDYFRDAGLNTGMITSKVHDAGGDVTVAMVRTMANGIKNKDATLIRDLARMDVVFVDEGHHSGAADYIRVLAACTGAGVRVILSGTALENKDKVKNMVVVGHSGPVMVQISNKEMFDAGVSRRPQVRFILSPDRQGMLMDYDTEYHELVVTSEARAGAILKELQAKPEAKTLVTFTEVEHGEFMFNYFTGHLPGPLAMTHGMDPAREVKLEMFKRGEITTLLVSMIAQEGLNIPGIKRMILAHGGNSSIRQKQLAGRGMRTEGSDDTEFELIDIMDRGKYTAQHGKFRAKLYAKEAFDVHFDYPHKKGVPIE